MTTREGSLEAPTRHPIDWRTPEYFDEAAILKEMERIFDICLGCRRCVSLCGAFPTLFDLVDESATMEVDGVAKADYWKVVDQCYLCDVCYMTKCPYVPPHPWNVDFPHLMLRGKAYKFRHGRVTLRDRILTSTDRVGRLATIPVVVKAVNAVNQAPAARAVMEKTFGVAAQAKLPPYAEQRLREHVAPSLAWPVRDAMFDPFEYLVARDRDGLLDRTFKRPLGKISYHIPCHSRVQNVGQKTRETLEWIPDTTVTTVERCAGHDGTWGVKREFYAD